MLHCEIILEWLFGLIDQRGSKMYRTSWTAKERLS